MFKSATILSFLVTLITVLLMSSQTYAATTQSSLYFGILRDIAFAEVFNANFTKNTSNEIAASPFELSLPNPSEESEATHAPITKTDNSVYLTAESSEQSTINNKILIAYFSTSGNTKNIANHLHDILDADLYAITAAIPYYSKDLNRWEPYNWVNKERNVTSIRPAIAGPPVNMHQYDVVFLGYPIWYGQAPNIIRTFLESYDFANKTIIPFCTSGRSGIGTSASNLHYLVSPFATWEHGARFASGAALSLVKDWMNALNLPKSTGSSTTNIDKNIILSLNIADPILSLNITDPILSSSISDNVTAQDF
jgi:flavodoxin